MDILKLLSRSTKPKGKTGAGTAAIKKELPSAGISNNPQLFHDQVTEPRGKKRKRNPENAREEKEQHVENLDFFASKATKPKPKKSDEKLGSNPQPQSIAIESPRLLDEDECRQIFRSHRLKATLLVSAKTPDIKIKKSKKQKKNKKPEVLKNKDLHPQPLVAFSDLRTTYGISKRLGENLAAQGYKLPTEVQMGSLPLLLHPETAFQASADHIDVSNGNIDLLAVAPTGSGKTLAFLIPIINSITQRRRLSNNKGLHNLEAIVVAPTKELAHQIVNEAKKLSLGTGLKVVGMRKGMQVVAKEGIELSEQDSSEDSGSEDDEEEEPKKASNQPMSKADILVTTPGLLLSAISNGSLSSVRTLVLDEADVLLDPLFRDQTLGIWESCKNPDLRVTLWSATMGSNIETLAASTIESRQKRLRLETPSSIVRLIVGLKDSAIPNITHRLVYAATEPGKLIALRQLLHPTSSSSEAASLRPPFLVFAQTIPRAVALHSELLYDIPAEAGGSTRIAVLHSDLSDSARSLIMSRFRNGEIWVLITTDILSRGVDFRGINGVVNYDVPNSGAAYIHRVGRTGRAGRSGGVAVTFYTNEDIPYVKNIANIIAASEKQAGKPASESSMQRWLLDALPTPSKEEKKKLKKYGVEARRGGLGAGKEGTEVKARKAKMQISTKSGYERKLENNRRGAIQGSRRRAQLAEADDGVTAESEFEGLDD